MPETIFVRTSSEYSVIWAFRIRPGQESEFERLYGAEGGWVRLFERAEGYLGTELFRDAEEAHRYVTIDRWRSREAYERFLAAHTAEYAALEARGAKLTESETELAALTPVLPN